MHAVVVNVNIEDFEQAHQVLVDEIIPMVKSAPGFVAGYWLGPEDGQGLSVVVFDSEEQARDMAKTVEVGAEPSEFVTVTSMTVREVVGHA
jgi:hypothetical protein